MKRLTVLIMFAGICQVVLAQGPTQGDAASTSRAAVKKEAREAVKSDSIPRGEASRTMNKDHSKSSAKRGTIKAETHAAQRSGSITRGDASLQMGKDATPSVADRAQVKAETREAQDAGLIPRGEAMSQTR